MTDEVWRDQLRSRGQRVTPQREAILRALSTLPHPTPESIHASLIEEEPGLSLSTVYRTLAVLQDLEIVSHAHIGPGSPVYHLVERPPHIHLSCLRCGVVVSVPIDSAAGFTRDVAESTGFRIDATHSAVDGVCAGCGTIEP